MSSDRPKAGPPPELSAPLEVLRELLAIERDRLETTRRIEAKREMVFPETTVIIRDIERLLVEIESREAEAAPAPAAKGGSSAGAFAGFEPADLEALE